ncbi:MAG TPA: hypothetical protein VHZ95_06030, partial [Polyangiales bacterium]|nr:hypothetical protein [Polyangiales bacterium]
MFNLPSGWLDVCGRAILLSLLSAFAIACAQAHGEHAIAKSVAVGAAACEETAPRHRVAAAAMAGGLLQNRFAYIPPQCYTNTRTASGDVANPCFVCHTNSPAPNYVDDLELQQLLKLPPSAATNPWTNLFSPAIARSSAWSDDDMRAYVRASNYFDASGEIALASRLAALPAEWDGDGDRHWGGYVPDAWFQFDRRGFDHRRDGSATGWRAFAYYPLPGTFFPTNGSGSDVLIRLDPALREDADGHEDARITEINLAIVEALIARRDVAIDPVDEASLGVDLDLDGALGRADRVRFIGAGEVTPMHYVGRARSLEGAHFPIAPGLFPLGTEFLHSLRYLDVGNDGSVTIAPRMKELRYAKKVRWFSYADLKAHADSEIIEQRESSSGGALDLLWEIDRGVYNKQGWLLQGFIEAQDGSLRPQTREESAF